MSYFSQEYIDFFIELSRNNHKDWFDANKKRYETYVKKPFTEFTREVIGEMKKIDKKIEMEPKDAIFRINRDIRFSKDKSPYKLYASAFVSNTHKKDFLTPGLYFQFSPESIWIGAGIYEPDKASLERIRYHIAGNLKKFDSLLKEKDFAKYFKGTIQGEKNKIVPKDLKEAAEKQPYIYNKQFYYMAEYKDPKKILDKKLVSFLVDHYKASQHMSKFLYDAVK